MVTLDHPQRTGAFPLSPPADDATDATLIGESLTNPDRFAGLFDRHADEIHRYVARRLDDVTTADDMTAETFLVAFRKRTRYDVRLLRLRGDEPGDGRAR